jgi:hypothetical protein
MWTRYVKLLELSVEGFQANVTLVAVMSVVCRLVGCVGGVRSFAARTGAGLRNNESTINTAAIRVVNVRKYSLFIFCSLCTLSIKLVKWIRPDGEFDCSHQLAEQAAKATMTFLKDMYVGKGSLDVDELTYDIHLD